MPEWLCTGFNQFEVSLDRRTRLPHAFRLHALPTTSCPLLSPVSEKGIHHVP